MRGGDSRMSPLGRGVGGGGVANCVFFAFGFACCMTAMDFSSEQHRPQRTSGNSK